MKSRLRRGGHFRIACVTAELQRGFQCANSCSRAPRLSSSQRRLWLAITHPISASKGAPCSRGVSDAQVRVQTFTGVTTGTVDNAFTLHHKTGIDLDAIGGYDFGMFRIEGEVAWKHAGLDDVNNFDPALLTAIGTATGVPVTATTLDVGGHVTALSGMMNGLVDFGGDHGVGGYVGAGVGLAGVKYSGGGLTTATTGLRGSYLLASTCRSARISISDLSTVTSIRTASTSTHRSSVTRGRARRSLRARAADSLHTASC